MCASVSASVCVGSHESLLPDVLLSHQKMLLWRLSHVAARYHALTDHLSHLSVQTRQDVTVMSGSVFF